MKRYLSIIVYLTVVLLFDACREDLKTTSVRIDNISDTTFVSKIDGRDIVFDIKSAKYDNGIVKAGDSVAVHYMGNLRDGEVKAALIRLIPRKPHVVDAVYDPSKPLKTKEMSSEEKADFDKQIEFAKEHNK